MEAWSEGVHARKRLKRRSGFTLIEALVAIFVIGLFTSALLPLFSQSDRLVRTAQNRELATQSAHEILEGLRQKGFGALTTIPVGVSKIQLEATAPTNLPKSTAVVIVTRVDSNFVPSVTETPYRRVQAVIRWQGLRSDRGVVTQTTLMVKE